VSSAAAQPAPGGGVSAAKERSPLAQLLHALNQPLTGLQCSLELAAAAPRSPQQLRETMKEGLELTFRVRTLVEAIREVVEEGHDSLDAKSLFELNAVMDDVAEDLRVVAEQKGLSLTVNHEPELRVPSSGTAASQALFRVVESAIGLADSGSELRVSARREGKSVVLLICWRNPRRAPSALSRGEIGLLVAQAAWEKIGAECKFSSAAGAHTCAIHWPAADQTAAAS
jgi:hypothetical protein